MVSVRAGKTVGYGITCLLADALFVLLFELGRLALPALRISIAILSWETQ